MKSYRSFFILFAVLILQTFNIYAQLEFTEVSKALNIDHCYGPGSGGGGVSFYDFDNDGWDDLTFATGEGQEIHFYKNIQGSFAKLTPPPINNLFEVKHLLWIDFDNDGDNDLYVTSFSQNLLYRNKGNFTFEEVTYLLDLPLDILPTYGATWADYNRDGWLDLYLTDKRVGDDFKKVGNRLFENQEGFYFNEVTLQTNSADSSKAPFCATFLDINNDNWQDIYIAQDRIQGNTLLKNTGLGYYINISSLSESNLKMNAMCVAIGDYNNDTYIDIYVSNTYEGNVLFQNQGNEKFIDKAYTSGVGLYSTGWGSNFLDYNNDGYLDIYACSSDDKNALFQNVNGNEFIMNTDQVFEKDTVRSYSNAIGDYNNDGFSDIAVNNADIDSSTLWQSPINDNNWLKVKLNGVYSNQDGIGTTIRAYSDDKVLSRYTTTGIGFLAQNSQNIIIGIGESEIIDSLEINWLSGIRDVLYNVIPNQTLNLIEGESTKLQVNLTYSDSIDICYADSLLVQSNLFGSNFQYHWSDGTCNPYLYVKNEGFHFLKVMDIYGTIYHSDSLYVRVNDQILTEVSITNVSCFGGNDGELKLNTDLDEMGYAINWSTGSYDYYQKNLSAGSYSLSVEDTLGCIHTEYFEVLEPESLNIDFVSYGSTNDEKNGSIVVNVEGGTKPYEFDWDEDLEFDGVFANNLAAGTYHLTVLDANNCQKAVIIDVSVVTQITQDDNIQIVVYPNPSSSDFKMIFDDSLFSNNLLTIVSSQFKEIYTQENIQSNQVITMKNCAPGKYFILFKTDEKTISFPIIKK